MKVLLVNKFFYRRAGAETAFFNLAELLESHGHAVVPFSTRHPESLPSPFAADFVAYFELDGPSTVLRSLRAARNFLYSRDAERRIERIIDKEKPDVAHLHNVYHHLSPSVLRPLRKRSIPTVMTLHDYKVVCPAYTLFSGGRICERCRGGRYAQAAFRRCAKGRSGRSLLLAAEAYLHGPVLRSYAGVDLFLSPSRFLLEKIRELGFGLPAEVVPNVFFADRFRPAANASGGRIVYAGRLAPEKGVAAFLRAVGDIAADVRIIGTGPDEARLKALAAEARKASVRFLGRLPLPALADEIGESLFVVCPSEWYENLPYAVLEAFALGKPVVASRIGGLPELVRDGETGWLHAPGDAAGMARRMKALLDDPAGAARMGEAARRFVEREFRPDRVYHAVMTAYGRAAG